jgi:uncharacterized protein YbjT (DUF2867 family)
MAKKLISVIGGTGLQGGGVVDALLAQGTFDVRAATRNPEGDRARALSARGVQVVKADLLDPTTIRAAFAGAHGAFVVTSFWDPGVGARETEIGTVAVDAARRAGVEHLVWSTLPDVESITRGRLKVVHFTGKSRVDAAVRRAGFARHTFVEAPFYFQNLLGVMAPQALPNGGRGWALPIDPALRVVHAGDVREVGRVVAGAFDAGDRLKDGSVLAVCGGTYSWNDFANTLNALGHRLQAIQVPADVFDGFFPGAAAVREMFEYFAEHTYFGPLHEAHIFAADALVPGRTSFADWAAAHMTHMKGEKS